MDREFTEDIDFLVGGGRAVVQPTWSCAFNRGIRETLDWFDRYLGRPTDG